MKRITLLLLGMVVAFVAHAGGAGAVRKTIESSMLVTGWAMIAPDGTVSGLELDECEKLPTGVTGLIDRAGTQWKFEPVLVDGKPRKAKARMSLRIVAKKLDADRYEVAIRSGYFGEEAMTPEERIARADSIKPLSMRPPSYPQSALQAGARGTVYLVVRIGRDGKAMEAFAEQVNLRVVGSEKEMDQLRGMFARSAINATRSWRFQLPLEGENASLESWTVRIPVDYEFYGEKQAQYGQWHTYVPGPRQSAPWELEQLDATQAPDSMIAGVLYQAGRGLRLLTPLQPG